MLYGVSLLSLGYETSDIISEGLREMFEGDSANMGARKFLLVSMGAQQRVCVRRLGSEDPHRR